jgi:hypothetical protein
MRLEWSDRIGVHSRKKAFVTEDTEVTEEEAFDWFCSVTSVLSVAGSFVSIDGPCPVCRHWR